MSSKFKYQIILNVIVLIWGLTGILGDLITISASKIVFFRTLIAFISLLFFGLFIKSKTKVNLKQIGYLILIGFIVGFHWLTFFYAIKISTISIGVVCMSLSTLFTSFLEPIFFKRKISFTEVIISLFILVGIIMIFGFEFEYKIGILVGLTSAFLAALFTVLNGKLILKTSPFLITKYEMLGATLVMGLLLVLNQEFDANLFKVTLNDFGLLLILGVLCTSVAFLVSVWVMKHLSPFTVSLNINMEPIYTIIIAILMFPEKEKMSTGFYIGGTIIIGAIMINALLKKRISQKMPQIQ
ncbi:MAG: DMT family transporter [Putridiphycobacter sp.]